MKRLGCLVFAMVAALWPSPPVSANGAAFFRPAGKHVKVDLAYFGTIRDQTGRRLDYADVTVSATGLRMTFPFSNDALGHYRSPDVGALIKEAGGVADPRQLEITCYVPGFKPMKRSVPRRAKGLHEVNFVLERDPAQTIDYELAGRPRASTTPRWGLVALLLFSAGAVNTAARRRSRDDSRPGRA